MTFHCEISESFKGSRRRSPSTVYRSPFTVLCSVFTAHCLLPTFNRSLLTVHHSPFTPPTDHRSPFTDPPIIVHHSLFTPPPTAHCPLLFTVHRSPCTVCLTANFHRSQPLAVNCPSSTGTPFTVHLLSFLDTRDPPPPTQFHLSFMDPSVSSISGVNFQVKFHEISQKVSRRKLGP